VNTNGGGLLRNALGTIARGFFLGIGFSVAVGGAYFVAMQVFMSSMSQNMTVANETTFGGETSRKDLILSNVEEQKHDGVTSIIGSVKNSGKKPARAVHIQANLFNHGKFVDQYSTYLSGTLAPEESQYFKISCGCKDTPPAEHDSYKVEVVTGF
jgi:hypothetical protein